MTIYRCVIVARARKYLLYGLKSTFSYALMAGGLSLNTWINARLDLCRISFTKAETTDVA
jgi:hypothetical protein